MLHYFSCSSEQQKKLQGHKKTLFQLQFLAQVLKMPKKWAADEKGRQQQLLIQSVLFMQQIEYSNKNNT